MSERKPARRSVAAVVSLFVLVAGGTGCVTVNETSENMLIPSPEPAPHASVLLRGRVSPETMELDPVIVVSGAAAPAAGRASTYLLRGFSAAGAVMFEVGLDAGELGSLPGREAQHFMAAAPVGPGGAMELERVELHGADGRLLERHARIDASAMVDALREGTALAVTSLGGDRIRLEWDPETFPLVQVRDPGRGYVLAVGRNGVIELSTDAEAIEVAVSEGVRSTAYRYALR